MSSGIIIDENVDEEINSYLHNKIKIQRFNSTNQINRIMPQCKVTVRPLS